MAVWYASVALSACATDSVTHSPLTSDSSIVHRKLCIVSRLKLYAACAQFMACWCVCDISPVASGATVPWDACSHACTTFAL